MIQKRANLLVPVPNDLCWRDNPTSFGANAQKSKYNVLFITVDDLRPELGTC
jgi:hypothetical protein